MQLHGEQMVLADQARTWQALNDPEVLRKCIPGCEAIVPQQGQEYRVEMATRIGPVSARFKGRLRLLEINEPHSYVLEFDGQGGAAGFGKGKAAVRLEPMGGQTRLHYSVEALVGGKLAQVGSRLIESAARKLSEDFFARFNEALAEAAPAAPEVRAELLASEAAAAVPASPVRRLNWAWLAGAGLTAAAVAAVLGAR